jgi:hypothetical protein
MDVVEGKLKARLVQSGKVKTWFAPRRGIELRPLLCKTLHTSKQDCIRFYGLTRGEAASLCARIKRNGSANTPVAVRI